MNFDTIRHQNQSCWGKNLFWLKNSSIWNWKHYSMTSQLSLETIVEEEGEGSTQFKDEKMISPFSTSSSSSGYSSSGLDVSIWHNFVIILLLSLFRQCDISHFFFNELDFKWIFCKKFTLLCKFFHWLWTKSIWLLFPNSGTQQKKCFSKKMYLLAINETQCKMSFVCIILAVFPSIQWVFSPFWMSF